MKSRTVFQLIRVSPEAEVLDAIDQAPLDSVNEYGQNMLQEAIAANKREVAKKLISNGIDLDHRDLEGRTSLHYAAIHEATDVAIMLIESKCGVNLSDEHGNGPLWVAVFQRNCELVGVLVRNRAETDHKNHSGRSPLDLARSFGDPILEQLLLYQRM